MSKENEALLQSIISGTAIAPDPQKKEEAVKPAPVAVKLDSNKEDGLVIPELPDKRKAPKQTPEESAAILRKQRDEYRTKTEELEEKLKAADEGGGLLKEIASLIKKDAITKDELKQIISDYDLTKKEKEGLEARYNESQAKLRNYSIAESPEYVENYIKPLQMAADALKAEVCPIIGDDYVEMPQSGRDAMQAILQSGDITPAKVKLVLNKIKSAYEAEDIDYDMPNVKNVTEHLLSIVKGVADKERAEKEWEFEKDTRQKEKEEIETHKGTILKAKSRDERKVIAQKFLNEFINREDYDYLAEDHGGDAVLGEIANQHNYLSGIIEDPAKAPTYDQLLEAYAKSALYDKMISDRIKDGKIAIASKKKASVENASRQSSGSTESQFASPNAELVAKMIKGDKV